MSLYLITQELAEKYAVDSKAISQHTRLSMNSHTGFVVVIHYGLDNERGAKSCAEYHNLFKPYGTCEVKIRKFAHCGYAVSIPVNEVRKPLPKPHATVGFIDPENGKIKFHIKPVYLSEEPEQGAVDIAENEDEKVQPKAEGGSETNSEPSTSEKSDIPFEKKCPKVSIAGSRSPSQIMQEVAGEIIKDLTRNGHSFVTGCCIGIDQTVITSLKEHPEILSINTAYPEENRKSGIGVISCQKEVEAAKKAGANVTYFPKDFMKCKVPARLAIRTDNVVRDGNVLVCFFQDTMNSKGTLNAARRAVSLRMPLYAVSPANERPKAIKGINWLRVRSIMNAKTTEHADQVIYWKAA